MAAGNAKTPLTVAELLNDAQRNIAGAAAWGARIDPDLAVYVRVGDVAQPVLGADVKFHAGRFRLVLDATPDDDGEAQS